MRVRDSHPEKLSDPREYYRRVAPLPDPLKIALDAPACVEMGAWGFNLEELAPRIKAYVMPIDEDGTLCEKYGVGIYTDFPVVPGKCIQAGEDGFFWCMGKDLHAVYVQCVALWGKEFNPWSIVSADYGRYCAK